MSLFLYYLSNIDSTSKVVVRYEYDAWGNHSIIGDEVIGNCNPFRYRGYYYDMETGLYYLQTRYYDPETGRFISQDSIEYADPETINGLNLYAYCGNNPVMRIDPTGTIAVGLLIALGILIGCAIGGAVGGAVNASNEGKEGWAFVGDIVVGALIGLCVGAAIDVLIAVFISPFGVSFFGLSGKALFAIGGVTFNLSGIALSIIFGVPFQPIEYGPATNPYEPIPMPTPYSSAKKKLIKTISETEFNPVMNSIIKMINKAGIYDRI